MFRYLFALWLVFCSFSVVSATYWRIDIKGPIGPGISHFVTEQLMLAQEVKPALVMLQIDTPGGLSESMRDINQAILASAIPVVGYVHPAGARAASAGTYILYACHIAAMSPATHLGAATPVQLLPMGSGEGKPNENQRAIRKKQLNDASAGLKALAELRGRNIEWAELAVMEGESITANRALALKVIDYIAIDDTDLLQQMDGRQIMVGQQPLQLDLQNLVAVQRQPDWRQRFIQIITNPNISYILIMLGIYGLILEFYSPGFGVAGVIGAICLLLALYALQMLPINYTGLALLLLGAALLIAEALVPSFGILGGGGMVALVMGSIFLFDSPDGALNVALPLIAAVASISFLFLFIVLRMLSTARRRLAVSGVESMVGLTAIALEDFNASGRARFQGEVWQAETSSPVKRGQELKIVQVKGLVLVVSTDNVNLNKESR